MVSGLSADAKEVVEFDLWSKTAKIPNQSHLKLFLKITSDFST
jgi:hypothetical protein